MYIVTMQKSDYIELTLSLFYCGTSKSNIKLVMNYDSKRVTVQCFHSEALTNT